MKRTAAAIISIALYALSPNTLAGTFTDEQICRAGIATNNQVPVKEIFAASSRQSGVIDIAYMRDADNKLFSYKCRVDNGTLHWKDSTMRAWSKNLIIRYKTTGPDRLHITIVIQGNEIDTKTFSAVDL